MANDDGFLSRWSRRKVVARALPAEPAESTAAASDVAPMLPPVAAPADLAEAGPLADRTETPSGAEAPPPLTLDDVAQLGRDSDYSPFVARNVAPDVRNAALKKLYTDPHYNVMDGLDTYIDDYGIPDPLPPGMLQQMTQTAFLRLFDDDASDAKPDGTDALPLAQSPTEARPESLSDAPADPSDPPEATPDEDPDLRLQPDDALERGEPGAGPDEDPRRQH